MARTSHVKTVDNWTIGHDRRLLTPPSTPSAAPATAGSCGIRIKYPKLQP